MARVVLDHVTKVYGRHVVAVDDLCLDVEDGELLVIVGPSGCGKSTTLRLVAGLEDITAGEIVIGGRTVTELPPKARDVAMVFQSAATFPYMTVEDNIGFGLKLRRHPKADIRRKVADVAAALGLEELLQRRPAELSGGQRQRVAIGRAMLREPSVFLMDEPLASLDARLRVQMRGEIARLQRRLGTTTLYVTHDQEEAMTLGSRVAVLNGGVLEQVGTAEELYRHPVSLFVATFIGSPEINQIDGVIEDGHLAFAGVRLPLDDVGLDPSPGAPVTVGLRPADLADGRAPIDGHASVAGVVETTEHLGAEVRVLLDTGAARLTACFDPAASPRVGETVTVSFAPHRLYVFDASTGRNLR
ncbi:MAG: ABC transporter ATP-binding protein [Acidimicrobiales bacterium]